MKAKYLRKSLLISSILAIAIITAVILLHFKSSVEIKAPSISLKTAADIYDIDKQNEIWDTIETYKKDHNFTFKDPLMIQNPFQTNTQSLYVYFKTKTPSSLEYTIHVNNKNIPDFTRTCYSGNENNMTEEHEYQLIGLIPDSDNEITLRLTDSSGKTEVREINYKAPSLLGKGKVILNKTDGESMESLSDGLYTVFAGDNFFYYYDNNGILRSEIPIIEYRCLRLIFGNDKMYYSAGKSTFVEMNSLGRLTDIYDLGQYNVHHDYTFDDDGNILLLGTDTTTDRVEDRILRLVPKTGEVSQVLDLKDIFTDYYKICVPDKEGELDWMHINTIQWLGGGSIVLSSRETSTILRINNLYSGPELEYMMGTDSFWKDTDYSSYLYEKANDFKSQLGQHSITYVQDDTLEAGQYYLYLFDNNMGVSTTRPDYKWTKYFDDIGTAGTAKNDETSFFYKYLVDENSKNYDLIESFPVPYSGYMGSVEEISGNVVVNSTTAMVFEEYDKNNQLICSFQTGSEKQTYRTYKYTFDNFYFYN